MCSTNLDVTPETTAIREGPHARRISGCMYLRAEFMWPSRPLIHAGWNDEAHLQPCSQCPIRTVNRGIRPVNSREH